MARVCATLMDLCAVVDYFSEFCQSYFCCRPKIHSESIAVYYSAAVMWTEDPT